MEPQKGCDLSKINTHYIHKEESSKKYSAQEDNHDGFTCLFMHLCQKHW